MLHTHKIPICEIDIGNPKSTKLRNWFRYETFYYLELKVIRHEVREIHSFYADLLLHRQLSTQPMRGARSAQSRLASPSSEVNLLLPRRELNELLFLKFQPTLPVSDVTQIPWSQSLSGIFYFDISEWHILYARVNDLRSCLHLSNLYTKRKVRILTKSKGKTYKTKSLRHYITVVFRARKILLGYIIPKSFYKEIIWWK